MLRAWISSPKVVTFYANIRETVGCPKLPTVLDDIGIPANAGLGKSTANHYKFFAESEMRHVP